MIPTRSPSPIRRTRRPHTKSRGGCSNCKMRRVKAFGVSCTYDRTSSALQPYAEAAFLVNMPQTTPVSMNQAVLTMLNDSLRRQERKDRAFQMTNRDLELLSKFHARTVKTVGDEATQPVYERESLRLAFQHPFLMHVVLTVTMMHDRSMELHARQSVAELFHWSEGTSQFNSKLSRKPDSLDPSERDAIWLTGLLLGCASFAQVDGSAPEEVWPLKAPSPADLDWLRMSDGKRAIWRIADPCRADSALHDLTRAPSDNAMMLMTDREALERLLPELRELCGLDDAAATPDDNPYWTAAAIIARLMDVSASQATLLRFLTFLSQMPPPFRLLLEEKEPRALILLAYFYAKISDYRQWVWRKRVVLESKAIFIYLRTCHSDIPHLEKILEFPVACIAHKSWQIAVPDPAPASVASSPSVSTGSDSAAAA